MSWAGKELASLVLTSMNTAFQLIVGLNGLNVCDSYLYHNDVLVKTVLVTSASHVTSDLPSTKPPNASTQTSAHLKRIANATTVVTMQLVKKLVASAHATMAAFAPMPTSAFSVLTTTTPVLLVLTMMALATS